MVKDNDLIRGEGFVEGYRLANFFEHIPKEVKNFEHHVYFYSFRGDSSDVNRTLENGVKLYQNIIGRKGDIEKKYRGVGKVMEEISREFDWLLGRVNESHKTLCYISIEKWGDRA